MWRNVVHHRIPNFLNHDERSAACSKGPTQVLLLIYFFFNAHCPDGVHGPNCIAPTPLLGREISRGSTNQPASTTRPTYSSLFGVSTCMTLGQCDTSTLRCTCSGALCPLKHPGCPLARSTNPFSCVFNSTLSSHSIMIRHVSTLGSD